ncbi:MAG: tetratricopeptide repeat protein [bacterium]
MRTKSAVAGVKKVKSKKLLTASCTAVTACCLLLSSCATVKIFRHSPLKIASSMERNGDIDGAIVLLKNGSASPKAGKKEKVEMFFALAALYEKKADSLAAIDVLKKAKGIDENNFLVRLKLGELFLKAGLWELSEKEFVFLEARGVKTPSLYRGLGEVYYRKKNLTQASFYFSQFLKIYPDDKEVLFKLYETDETRAHFSASRSSLAAVSGTLKKDDFSMRLALNWMKDNNPDEAIEELKKIEKEYPEAVFLLGLAHYQKGEIEKAIECFSAENEKFKYEARFFLALALWESGFMGKARPIFEELRKKDKFTDYCAVFLD